MIVYETASHIMTILENEVDKAIRSVENIDHNGLSLALSNEVLRIRLKTLLDFFPIYVEAAERKTQKELKND